MLNDLRQNREKMLQEEGAFGNKDTVILILMFGEGAL